jgi:hypothetical protein
MDWNFEFESTYRCNTVCEYCNRLVGVIKIPDSDLTPDQVRYAIRMLREMRFYSVRIKISGGEPEMNPHIEEIVDLISTYLKPKHLWVLQNGILPDAVERERAVVKINALPKQNHDPFAVSPIDAGLEEHQMVHACLNRSQTGGAFDSHGFTFCALAPIIGRVLRINPYKPYPIFDQDYDICRHCPLSLNKVGRQKLYSWAQLTGNYPSKTYKEGIKAYKEDPFLIPRLQVTPNDVWHEAELEPEEEEAPEGYKVVV